MRLQARRVQSATNTHEVITARPVSPASDSIITIQYQEFKRGTGKPLGDLTVLRFWESSEGDVLHHFSAGVPVFDQNPFVFVPVGYNLKFEYRFLLKPVPSLRAASHRHPLKVVGGPARDGDTHVRGRVQGLRA